MHDNRPDRTAFSLSAHESSRRAFLATGALVAGTVLLPVGRPAVAKKPKKKRLRLGWIGHDPVLEGDTPYLVHVVRSELVEVTAVSEATPERIELCQEIVKFETGKKPAAYKDYSALIQSGAVDALLSNVPGDTGLKLFRAGIEAGVHCFGPFPPAQGKREVDALLKLQARRPKVKFQLSAPWRHQLRYREAARLVREDQVLGRLKECKYRLSRRRGSGGGAVTFPGCDLVTWYTGRRPLRARPDKDPHSPVVLEYSDNFTVRFWPRATRFFGTRGEMDATSGNITYASPASPGDRTLRVDGTSLWQPRPELREIDDFFETIIGDRTPLVTMGQFHDSVLVSLLAHKAHNEKRTVTWEEITA